MRSALSSALVLGVAVIAGAASPGAVSAHALLRSSTPAAGATLGGAPAEVSLTFSETPDLRLTSIKVLDSGGVDHVAGPPQAVAEPPQSVLVPVGDLADGAYTVSWRTVSAVDGHVSAGSFVFGVGVAPPSGPPEPVAGVGQVGTPPGIVARWLLYLGLVGLLGVAFAALAVARRPAPDLLAMAALGWILAALGTFGVVAVQWLETGAPLETLPSTSVGAAALARTLALGFVGVALALAALPGFRGLAGWAAVGLTTGAALGVDVATGHAAAGPGWLPQVIVQWLHGLAAAIWLGGLAALLVLLRSTPADERMATARRFSRWAGVALVVVALTGVARAVAEVGTVAALFATDFGRVVIAKSALLVGLAGLGAANRFITFRNAERLVARLRRVGGAELGLAVIVLGLSALLVNLSPPASAGEGPSQPTARPIVALGSDFGTSVKVRLVASPGAAGLNQFDVAVVDYDTAEPVEATAVELRFELASRAGVEPSTLQLDPAGPGRFGASGDNLSIDGIWRLTATVAAGSGAVEVPLLAVTSVPPQPVDVLVSPDVPTIYTIQLGAPGSAQVYLDPGGAGPNELHVTFFDPSGSALPVESVTIATRSETGGAAILTPRLLEPGHFVASVEATVGPLDVDAIGPLPGGTGQIHVHVTIEVEP